MERKFEWDGEKIKETISMEEKKHSPKDFIVALDSVRGQIGQMRNDSMKLEQQLKAITKNLKDITVFEKELTELESKTIELQKEKILSVIKHEGEKLSAQAAVDAVDTIALDPSAYSDSQKENMAYINYQRALAIHKKMAENVAPRMIQEFLFTKPVFDNPFKKSESNGK